MGPPLVTCANGLMVGADCRVGVDDGGVDDSGKPPAPASTLSAAPATQRASVAIDSSQNPSGDGEALVESVKLVSFLART